ncbi:uncharacterized protein LOC129597841 [Paramacrobiotus metropolitanus]|uniref:uncharacterized protein LOC129597841 n=1 Tax=Paramacrobiotus metropolitanus TaxID=2943436 RepID=UPI002445694C|nr:uncharacterized protein LOC129597841 [Paramacrobiotus metropolitanus]
MTIRFNILILSCLSFVLGSNVDTYKNTVLFPYKEALVYFADAVVQPLASAPVPTGDYQTDFTEELKAFIRDSKNFHAKIHNLSTAAETEKVKMNNALQRKTMELSSVNTHLTQRQNELRQKNAELQGQQVQLNEANGQLQQARLETAQAQRVAEEARRKRERQKLCWIFPPVCLFFLNQKKKVAAAEARQRNLEARVRQFDQVFRALQTQRNALQNQVHTINGQKHALEQQRATLQTQLKQESEVSAGITLFYGHMSSLFDHSASLQNIVDQLISVDLVLVPLEQIFGKISTLTGHQQVNEEISAVLSRLRINMLLLKETLTKYPLFLLSHVVP